ncbi:MAG: undecaprenyl diphosphate synthase [Kiritimatiellia bacterium]|jgi:undecaprenyl diphosphate synthase
MDWTGRVPEHVAIIMDGNGRWATRQGLSRLDGHAAGAESVRQIVRACGRHGVKVLTLYSFSTENWSRPDEEVNALMTLLERYLREELHELMSNKVRLSAIGQLHRLPEVVRQGIAAVSALTAKNDGLRLVLALSYGSRAEIVDAVRHIALDVHAGELDPNDIDADTIGGRLYTAGLPDPDLLIRTSGELRLSNFLLWQVAYSELYVTNDLWPDFREEHLLRAFDSFAKRQRRFGKTGSQIEAET